MKLFISVLALALSCMFLGSVFGYVARSAKFGDALNWKYEYKFNSCENGEKK